MKLNADKFRRLLKKASLDYYFDSFMLNITPDGTISERTGSDLKGTFFYMRIKDKNAITEVKKPETLYFANSKELRGFFKGDKDIYNVKRENIKDPKNGKTYPYIICTLPKGHKLEGEAKRLVAHPEEIKMDRFEYTELPLTVKIDIDEKLIKDVQIYKKLCDTRISRHEERLIIIFDKGKVYLNVYTHDMKDFKVSTQLGEISGYFGTSLFEFNPKLFAKIFKTIDPKGKNSFSVMFDAKSEYGYVQVESEGGDERYILMGSKVVMESPVDITTKIDLPVLVEESWNYHESVNKVKGMFYSWKKMTFDMYCELCTARKVLALSKADAARIKHGLISPAMTWTTYCEEIGYTRQSVDRWIALWEEKQELEAGEKKDGNSGRGVEKKIDMPQEIQEMITASLANSENNYRVINGLSLKKDDFEKSLKGDNVVVACKNVNSPKLREFVNVLGFKNGVCLAYKGKEPKVFIKNQKGTGAVVYVRA